MSVEFGPKQSARVLEAAMSALDLALIELGQDPRLCQELREGFSGSLAKSGALSPTCVGDPIRLTPPGEDNTDPDNSVWCRADRTALEGATILCKTDDNTNTALVKVDGDYKWCPTLSPRELRSKGWTLKNEYGAPISEDIRRTLPVSTLSLPTTQVEEVPYGYHFVVRHADGSMSPPISVDLGEQYMRDVAEEGDEVIQCPPGEDCVRHILPMTRWRKFRRWLARKISPSVFLMTGDKRRLKITGGL